MRCVRQNVQAHTHMDSHGLSTNNWTHAAPLFSYTIFFTFFFFFLRDYTHPDTSKIDSDLSTATYRPRSSNPIKKIHPDPPATSEYDVHIIYNIYICAHLYIKQNEKKKTQKIRISPPREHVSGRHWPYYNIMNHDDVGVAAMRIRNRSTDQ